MTWPLSSEPQAVWSMVNVSANLQPNCQNKCWHCAFQQRYVGYVTFLISFFLFLCCDNAALSVWLGFVTSKIMFWLKIPDFVNKQWWKMSWHLIKNIVLLTQSQLENFPAKYRLKYLEHLAWRYDIKRTNLTCTKVQLQHFILVTGLWICTEQYQQMRRWSESSLNQWLVG